MPFARTAERATAGRSAPVGPPVGQGLRILLAEDNAINRLVAVRVLNKAGHQVVVAVDGQEAVAAVKRREFSTWC